MKRCKNIKIRGEALLKKITFLTVAQIIFIYLFTLEQNAQLNDIFFPFSIIMVMISVMFTIINNGMDIKQKGIRFFGVLAIRDEPIKNEGPYKLKLVNSFSVSSVCVMIIAVLYSFI